MNGGRLHKWKIPVIVAALVVVIGIAAAAMTSGIWDSSQTVRVDPSQIESSTLAIGTHLIHLSALNDSLYEIAQISAEESGQSGTYYKSELAGGAWFDISSATTLADITTGGSPVSDDVIRSLLFEYHTKSDKKTYDLRTGKSINVFDIRDPYGISSMDELYPLKLQYEMTLEGKGTNDITERIDGIWDLETKFASTEIGSFSALEIETQLAALQRYLDDLNNRGEDAQMTGIVTEVMDRLDACRRYLVCAAVEPALQAFSEDLNRATAPAAESGEEDQKETEKKLDSAHVTTEMISAVSESQSNLQDSMITYAGKMLTEGSDVLSIVEYELTQKLIADAAAQTPSRISAAMAESMSAKQISSTAKGYAESHRGGSFAACDSDVRELLHLKHILNDVISDRMAELDLLNQTLLPLAKSRYTSLLRQGVSPEYRAERAKGAPQVVLDRLVKDHEGNLNRRRGELEFLQEAKASRLDPVAASEDTKALMEELAEASGRIPQDDFASAAQSSINQALEIGSDKVRSLELATGGNRMDQLTKQKEELQTERMAALDQNDLVAAQAIDAKLDEVEDQIRGIEKEATAQMNQVRDQIAGLEKELESDPNNGELQSQLVNAQIELQNLEKQLSDGSLGATVAQLKNDALNAIQSSGAPPAAVATDSELVKDQLRDQVFLAEELLAEASAQTEASLTSFDEVIAMLTDALSQKSGSPAMLAKLDAANTSLLDFLEAVPAGTIRDFAEQLQERTEKAIQEILDALEDSGEGGGEGSGEGGGEGSGEGGGEDGGEGSGELREGENLRTLRELLGLNSGFASEQSALNAESIADVQDYLDKLTGLLDGASEGDKLRSQILELETELNALKKGLDDPIADSVTGLQGHLLDAIITLSSGVSGGSVGEITTDDGSDLADIVETLASLLPTDPGMVLPAVQAVHDALALKGGNDALLDVLEQAILDNPQALAGHLNSEQLKQIVDDFFEEKNGVHTPFMDLSFQDAGVALQALEAYLQETNNTAAAALQAALAQRLSDLGDARVFNRIEDPTGEYLPLKAIQEATGRRFVWNQSRSMGVLAKGSDYYGFTLYSAQVLRDSEGLKTEDMLRIARNLGGLHVPTEYAQEAFGVWALYLSGTSLGYACTEADETEVQALVNLLLTT